MGLIWENIRETFKEFIKGIGCKHKWIEYGIKDRCGKCGRLRTHIK